MKQNESEPTDEASKGKCPRKTSHSMHGWDKSRRKPAGGLLAWRRLGGWSMHQATTEQLGNHMRDGNREGASRKKR